MAFANEKQLEEAILKADVIFRPKKKSLLASLHNLYAARHLWFGPTKRYKGFTNFIPQRCRLNSITPKIRLGFIGDILQLKSQTIQFDSKMRKFFSDVDYIVGNFESVITRKPRKYKIAQRQLRRIIPTINTLAPSEKLILSVANNHSGDFGQAEFNNSYRILEDHGVTLIGRNDHPFTILKDAVQITACTGLTNYPSPYLTQFREINAFYNPEVAFNILFPHWGYEFELYPNPDQIIIARTLLEKWDLIAGHHSHCPQPITAYKVNNCFKICAYSLGDFIVCAWHKLYNDGLVFKVSLGPSSDGTWQAGKVEWKFIKLCAIDDAIIENKLENTCKYFKDKLSSK